MLKFSFAEKEKLPRTLIDFTDQELSRRLILKLFAYCFVNVSYLYLVLIILQ